MKHLPQKWSLPRLSLTGIILTLVLLLAACGGESTSASPTSPPALGPTSTTGATQTATPPTAGSSTSIPGSTFPPTGDPASPLILELLAPDDGAGVEVDTVRVMGKTRIDAVVSVNGTPVEVTVDGNFQHDLMLETGPNLVEVLATTLSGETATQEAAVFFISTAAGLPFTLFFPPDGLTVTEPDILVVGGTSPEAVVGVDGIPVDINGLGIFSTTVALEDGVNFIEVLATDINGNVRFQTVAVFYLP